MLWLLITVPRVAFSACNRLAAAETSTDSVTSPTWSVKSRRTVCCTWTSMLLLVAVLKPGCSDLRL